MQNELQSTVASSFSCPREAFRFFLRNNKNPVDKVISFQAFQQSINSLLPKRHSKEMIKLFWNDCSRNKQSINFSEFCMHFDNQPFTAQSTQRSQKSQYLSSRHSGRTFISSRSAQSGGKWQMNVIDKVRKTLRASVNMYEMF